MTVHPPNLSPAILHVVLRPRYSGAEMLVKALIPMHAGHGCRTAVCALLPSEAAFLPELKKLELLGCELFVPETELNRPQRVFQVARAIRRFKPDFDCGAFRDPGRLQPGRRHLERLAHRSAR